jgi:hypothetical protein
MIKKNDQIVCNSKSLQAKAKRKLKRRKSIGVKNLKDKINFFKHVHKILNYHPEGETASKEEEVKKQPSSSSKKRVKEYKNETDSINNKSDNNSRIPILDNDQSKRISKFSDQEASRFADEERMGTILSSLKDKWIPRTSTKSDIICEYPKRNTIESEENANDSKARLNKYNRGNSLFAELASKDKSLNYSSEINYTNDQINSDNSIFFKTDKMKPKLPPLKGVGKAADIITRNLIEEEVDTPNSETEDVDIFPQTKFRNTVAVSKYVQQLTPGEQFTFASRNASQCNNTEQSINNENSELAFKFNIPISSFSSKFLNGRCSTFKFLDHVTPKMERYSLQKRSAISRAKTSSMTRNTEYTLRNQSNLSNIKQNNYMLEDGGEIDLSKNLRGSKILKQMTDPFIIKFFDHEDVIEGDESTRLAHTTSKRITVQVVFIVLIILFINPFLGPENYTETMSRFEFHNNQLASFLASGRTDLLTKLIYKTLYNEQFRLEQDLSIIEFGFINNMTRSNYNLTSTFQNDVIFKNETAFNTTRLDDRIYISNDYFYLVYNKQNLNALHSILNITRVIFIALCLWLFSFFFVYDINNYVVIPLEEIFNIMREKKITTEMLYYNVDKALESDMMQLRNLYEEILNIEKFFRTMSCLIVRVIGIRFYSYFKSRILAESELDLNQDNRCISIGYIMICKIRNFDQLVKKYDIDISTLLSRVINIIDLTVYEHFGEIMRIDGDTIVVFFDNNFLYNEIADTEIIKDEKLLKLSQVYQANFSIISAIKIISRIRFYIEDENIDINLVLHKGKLNQFLINTSNKVENCLYSKHLKQAFSIAVNYYLTLGKF